MKELLAVLRSLGLLSLCFFCACTSQPAQPEKPQPKAPEFITGRAGFQKVYVAAHGWARDAQPYRLESMNTADSKGKDGKSTVWRGSFASASQGAVKSYTWSGEDGPDVPSRGINPGTQDNYSPSNSSTQVFDINFLKLDSDKALETAKKHGGDKILAKDPDAPITYACDWSRATSELIWHVIFGDPQYPKLRVAVNASTGDFIRVEK
jgi:hypothetical protein